MINSDYGRYFGLKKLQTIWRGGKSVMTFDLLQIQLYWVKINHCTFNFEPGYLFVPVIWLSKPPCSSLEAFFQEWTFSISRMTLLEQTCWKLLKRSFARSFIIYWVDLLAVQHGLQIEALWKQRTIVQYQKKVEKIYFNPIYFRWQRDLLEIIESSYVENSIIQFVKTSLLSTILQILRKPQIDTNSAATQKILLSNKSWNRLFKLYKYYSVDHGFLGFPRLFH